MYAKSPRCSTKLVGGVILLGTIFVTIGYSILKSHQKRFQSGKLDFISKNNSLNNKGTSKLSFLAKEPSLLLEIQFEAYPARNAKNHGSKKGLGKGIYFANPPKSSLALPNEETGEVLPSVGRLIFVGDIHGCLDEFEELLRKSEYKHNKDKLVLLGDLVGKGPKSLGVVRKAIELEAYGVRGNHDDLVLRWYDFLHSNPGISDEALENYDLPYKDFRTDGEHIKIAKAMSKEEYAYLVKLPAIIHFKSNNESLVAVHGGLDPKKLLNSQNPAVVMRMRNILDSGVPMEKKNMGGSPWSDIWNESKERSLASEALSNSSDKKTSIEQVTTVFYGHDAGRGLQLKSFTKGLDSGCVYGRKLSALIYPQYQLVQADCPGYAPIK